MGTAVWDSENNKLYLEEQINLKVFQITGDKLELLEDIKAEGHPFIVENKGQKEFYVEGF